MCEIHRPKERQGRQPRTEHVPEVKLAHRQNSRGVGRADRNSRGKKRDEKQEGANRQKPVFVSRPGKQKWRERQSLREQKSERSRHSEDSCADADGFLRLPFYGFAREEEKQSRTRDPQHRNRNHQTREVSPVSEREQPHQQQLVSEERGRAEQKPRRPAAGAHFFSGARGPPVSGTKLTGCTLCERTFPAASF